MGKNLEVSLLYLQNIHVTWAESLSVMWWTVDSLASPQDVFGLAKEMHINK